MRTLRALSLLSPHSYLGRTGSKANLSSVWTGLLGPAGKDKSLSSEEAGTLAHEKRMESGILDSKKNGMETFLAHVGVQQQQPNAPLSPPIHLSTTYTRPANGIYGEADYIYSRTQGPTHTELEKAVGVLECYGEPTEQDPVTCAFSSGMAAACGIIMAHDGPLTVLLPKDLYHGVPTVLVDILTRFNVLTEQIDVRSPVEVESAIRSVETDNVILWMESPSNPQCHVIDIEQTCKLIKTLSAPIRKVTTVVDSTLAPPVISQPLRLGADVVMHSATKYLAGHSDTLLGIITASPWTETGRKLGKRLHDAKVELGSVASGFDSWLTMRGMRTLHVRVERQCQNAMQLAQMLESRSPFVTKVHYPGLESHPHHEIARKQMKTGMFGGVLSLELEDEVKATAVAAALSTAVRATSLGGTETLVEHRASIEPPLRQVSPEGLLRVSVGLEDIDDLIRDFDQALQIAEEITS